MFYSHRNSDGNIIVIPFAMGTHQGDLLKGALFALIHLRALYFATSHFPSCLFPSMIVDIHIIDPPSIVSFAYENFQTKFHAIGLFIQNA
jgi:hypothetical protein